MAHLPDRRARLDRAQLRIARRVAGRLRDGGLVFVVGCDDRRRRAFEAALADEGTALVRGQLELDGDPWAQIEALARTGATPCVSWAQGGNVESFLSTLNLGRERFADLPAGLVMWIGGLAAIETFPAHAPDLWAYRAGVEWVLSAADFRATLPTNVPRPILVEERLATSERELGRLSVDDPRRIRWLLEAAAAQKNLDRMPAAIDLQAEAERIWSVTEHSDRFDEHAIRGHKILMAMALGRESEALLLLESDGIGTSQLTIDWQIASCLNVAGILTDRGHFTAADSLLSSVLRLATLELSSRVTWTRGGVHACAAELAALRGRVDDAYSLAISAIDLLTVDEHWWEPMRHAERTMHSISIDLLRPFDALVHAVRRHSLIAENYSAAMAADDTVPIVDGLLSLGLRTDAYGFVDATMSAQDLSERRRLSLRALRARTLMAGGATTFGATELWLTLDGYRTALTTAHPVDVARLSLAALDLITQDLVHLAPTLTEADELRELGLSLANTAEQMALAERQEEWARDLRSAAATLLRELGRHEDARARLEQNLTWSQQHEGPSRICRAHLELARLDTALGQSNQALLEIEQARQALESDPPEMQPHAVWRELLLEHAHVLAAAGQPQRGRAEALEASTRMAKAGLAAEELAALHVLAEVLPGEGCETLPERERAAAQALALSANSGLIDEEARALANFALIHAEQGRRAAAEAMIAEARWLIEDRPHGRIRDHVHTIGARLHAMLASSDH